MSFRDSRIPSLCLLLSLIFHFMILSSFPFHLKCFLAFVIGRKKSDDIHDSNERIAGNETVSLNRKLLDNTFNEFVQLWTFVRGSLWICLTAICTCTLCLIMKTRCYRVVTWSRNFGSNWIYMSLYFIYTNKGIEFNTKTIAY